jgi:hypothetical protein
MFSAIGTRFQQVSCPRLQECSLTNCIFLHAGEQQVADTPNATSSITEYDPFSAGDISLPPAKRRRVSSSELNPEKIKKADLLDLGSVNSDNFVVNAGATRGPTKKPAVKQSGTDNKPQPASVTRPVSPPASKASNAKPPADSSSRPKLKKESLIPRTVPRPPTQLKTRLTVVQKLHKEAKAQNEKLAAAEAKWKPFVLNEQELITFALDSEEAATKLGDANYKGTISHTIIQIKRMTTDQWIKKVSEWIGLSTEMKVTNKATDLVSELKSVGLASLSEQTAVLSHLRTPLEGLEKHGYVTEPPSDAAIAAAELAFAAAEGYELCDRCGTRFQVIPGRDDEGRLTTRGKCHYHWARVSRLNKLEAIHPCCNKSPGSEGCSEAETHVFAAKDPKRLASILQFEHTPQNSRLSQIQPVSFDCEMGYTTLGMEVIRVTAVAWPDGRLLLDILVRTYGEILDLNTRFSGVTPEAYSTAIAYSDMLKSATHAELNDLQKVESPAAARKLLSDLICPHTPLLGHAIDNDLNVLRIIHPFVVDTVLLYPHPRGLPIRFGLKVLSHKHLGRGIQMAGAEGHDSKEDAIATGDLITKKVVEKWKVMQHDGWRFSDGLLLAPDEADGLAEGGKSML